MKKILKSLVGLVLILAIGSGVFLRNVLFDLKHKDEIKKICNRIQCRSLFSCSCN